MEIGLVRKIDIDEEMQQAYLDYAMSVIVARALPDARDGLKPVHRRILYAMHDMGLASSSAYKKSARIVGEVLGKYHPHGDMAVYDAMARMAQTFSLRALLVDGQGNFGSVDGDPPAAMRYTEARLTALAESMLADINKNTVDFTENFDGTLTEPDVTPAAFPNLLVNGATGIAVGMMTSIPPHNLGEVIDGLVYMLGNWDKLDDITVEELMGFIQGPDFPTGGVIIQDQDSDSLSSAYATGRGRVIVQAKAHMEEMVRGRNRIIVTELPYMTNKSSLIERIAALVREEKIEGIADLRDESDRQGMRIVIELNKAAEPEAVLRELYKNTQMRSTFSLIMLALVGGEPRLLSLKQALRVYLEHRLTIVRRRSEFELARARQRAHILEGLRVALKNLDEVIGLIRKAPDAETARERLMKRFRLSEMQAQAILDMQLRRLAALERKKIEDEYKALLATIKELESLLRSPKKMRQVVADELLAIKSSFADPRRTRIVHLGEGESRTSLLTTTDLVPEQPVWVMLNPDGLLSRTPGEQLPKLGGQDLASILVQASTHDTLYLVGENGEAAAIPLHVLPQAASPEEGAPFHKLSPLKAEDRLAAAFALPARDGRAEGHFLLTVTRQGMVKKSALAELPGPSAQTFVLVKVNPGDRLGWVCQTDGEADLLLATAEGMAIRFKEEAVRPMGLVAAGVMGIKLQAGDEIVAAELFPARGEILLVASDGSAKRVEAGQFPRQGRYGQGVIAWKLPKGVRVAGMACGTAGGKSNERVTLLLENAAPKSIRLDEAPLQTRAARGRQVLPSKGGLKVIRVSKQVAGLQSSSGSASLPRPKSPVARLRSSIDGRSSAAGRQSSGAGRQSSDDTASVDGKTPAKTAPTARRGLPGFAEAHPPTAQPGLANPGQAKQPGVRSDKEDKPPKKTGAKKTEARKPAAKAAPAAQKTAAAKTKTVEKPATKKPAAKAARSAQKPAAKAAPAAQKRSALPAQPGLTNPGQRKPAAKQSAAKKAASQKAAKQPAIKQPATKKPAAKAASAKAAPTARTGLANPGQRKPAAKQSAAKAAPAAPKPGAKKQKTVVRQTVVKQLTLVPATPKKPQAGKAESSQDKQATKTPAAKKTKTASKQAAKTGKSGKKPAAGKK